MIFVTLLVGFLAVGHAAAGWEFNPRKEEKVVQMTVFKKNDTSGAYDVVDSANSTLVSKISSSKIPFRVRIALEFLDITGMRRMVEFKAHYRAPLGAQYMSLRFTFLFDLRFQWGLPQNIGFLHPMISKKCKDGMCISHYKIKTRPGTVFSISLKVMKIKMRHRFHVEWVKTKLGPFVPPQPVALKKTEEPVLITPKCDLTPLSVQQLASPWGHVSLSQTLESEIIEKHAKISPDGEHFMMMGYFRPRFKNTRLVLASTARVAVGVYTPTLLQDNKKFQVHQLISQNGVAQESVLSMNPDLLYMVMVAGPYVPGMNHDISFWQHNPKHELISIGVDLLVLDPKQNLQLQTGDPKDVPDLIDFCSRPNSVAEDSFIWDFGSREQDSEPIKGVVSPNADNNPFLDNLYEESGVDPATLEKFAGLFREHTEALKSVKFEQAAKKDQASFSA